jgi:type III restriction enzyme
MARKSKKNAAPSQVELLDITAKLRTAPCVPALREAVKAWKAGGYKGITDTTRILLNHWFCTDHRLRTGLPFKYHASQQEAIETLIFVWEYEKIRTRKGLLERYAQDLRDLRLPPYDEFARYSIKMATGSGKTKVMALAGIEGARERGRAEKGRSRHPMVRECDEAHTGAVEICEGAAEGI